MAARKYINPGTQFGFLSYIEDIPAQQGIQRRARFQCRCGKVFESRLTHVTGGKTVSCGCHSRSQTASRSQKHDAAHRGRVTPEYRIWLLMRRRCDSPNNISYPNYGGRGVRVCERWNSFENFLVDMGPRPSPSHALDRYPDGDGNYEPGNCRWATKREQANNRRNTPMIEYLGRTQSIANWARELDVKYWSLRNRIINLGWPVEKAFSVPFEVGRNQYD